MRTKPSPHALLDFIREANSLEAIPRGGFVISGIQNAESVQAHSHGVALTALLLAELEGQPFDAGRLLLMALLHDVAESRTGDIVLRFQHYFPEGALDHAERLAGGEILAGLPQGWRAAYDEVLSAKSREARLVRAADKLQMMIKVAAYEDQHRGDLSAFWKNPKNFRDHGIPAARRCFAALAKARGRKIPRVATARKRV
jgi:putative hydrolase of HD superfamily